MTETATATESKPTGEMAVMSREEGDARISWNKGNEAEVASARRTFDELTGPAKGYSAFRVDSSGASTGARIREFDPDAESIVLVPRMVGG